MTRRLLPWCGLLLMGTLLVARPCEAQDSAGVDASSEAALEAPARVHHVPPASWPADTEQRLSVRVERDWNLAALWAELALEAPPGSVRQEVFARACREHPSGTLDAASGRCRLELRRAPSTPDFVAVVPAAMVQPPGLSYRIAGQPADDAQPHAHFASAERPWRVQIEGESEALAITRKLERHDGHRSRFELRGDVSLFGSRLIDAGSDAPRETDTFSDLYGSGVLSYTYRTLGWLYAFRFGVGVMRGRRATVDGVTAEASAPEPGFNWGYGEVDFELHRNFSWAGRVILGASERGFAAGLGTLMRIGPLFATHFEVGVDWTSDLGVNTWMGLNWDTVPRVPMGLKVEYTTWPDADGPAGVRLLYNATWRMTQWLEAGASIGYATRLDALEGGLVTGLNTAMEF